MHINHSVLKNQRLPPLIFFTWFQSMIAFIGDGQLSYIYIVLFFQYGGCAHCPILDKITGNYFIYEDSN